MVGVESHSHRGGTDSAPEDAPQSCGSAGSWLDQMTAFYQLFPYPGRGLLVFPQPSRMLYSHVGFARVMSVGNQSWARRTWKACHPSLAGSFLTRSSHVQETRADLVRIFRACEDSVQSMLLAGCGTDEPVLHAALHVRARIRAIDLSKRSLRRAKLKLGIYAALHPARMWRDLLLKRRVVFEAGDLVDVLQRKPEVFDHIQCVGVLHHQKDPFQMLGVLAASLKPAGALRLMVYSRSGRGVERAAQRSLLGRFAAMQKFGWVWRGRMLWRAFLLKVWYLKSVVLRTSGASRRFRYTRGRLSHMADALLHPSDPGLDPVELAHRAGQLGLQMVYCCARSCEDGWMAGFGTESDVNESWMRIAEAERSGDLESNVELIFVKPG